MTEADETRHVSSFAHLPRRHRPAVRCPQCHRPLILKLGSVRRHHAAHDPGDVCAATRPETALHLNCKFALAEALRAAGVSARLSMVQRCAGAGRDACDRTVTTQWLHGWDDVLVEHRLDTRRPDLILRRNGAIVGAIEIVVSNAVSAEKAQALASLGVPWIEVAADEQLAGGAWTVTDVLHVSATNLGREWRCEPHRVRHGAFTDAADERKAVEREAQRHTAVLRAARVVDVYHADGARDRFIYSVRELLIDGRLVAVSLRRGGAEIIQLPLASTDEFRPVAWPQLRLAFGADVQRFFRDGSSFSDSPMRWADGDAAENIVDEALTDRVGRDPTPLATRFPRRWFFAKEQQRWFLPPDMQDVAWDRARADAFGAHPAWVRQRASRVGEPAAPEGSWRTPVFASRPTASMFAAPLGDITRHDGGAIGLIAIASSKGPQRRAIAVIERKPSPNSITALAELLRADAIETVWVSHPLDWSNELAPLTWLPAGRDGRGRGGVVVDGVGIFRADQFGRALANNDRRLQSRILQSRMANRVERLANTTQVTQPR